MITISNRTNNIKLTNIDDLLPYLSKVKTFRKITPVVKERLIEALDKQLIFSKLKSDFMSFIKKDILGCRSGKFSPIELMEIFGWSESEVALEGKWSYDIKNIKEFIPHLEAVSKVWRKLTPTVEDRLNDILFSRRLFSNKNSFYLYLRKNVLGMRSGTFKKEHYIDIFGWGEEEADKLLQNKGMLFKESTGAFPPSVKEFWVKHHSMSEEDAIKAVSVTQRKLSIRKKTTTVNLKNSISYYLYRGYTEDDAIKLQSEEQKKRRNNCVEYWTARGYSEEDAKKEISEIQKKRSKLSIEYWLHRGFTLEQAQEESEIAIKNQCTGRISKISQKFFNELINILEIEGYYKENFLFGTQEFRVFITPKRRMYLDFLHVASKKVIEFDGKYWHEKSKEKDDNRDFILEDLGYQILRIPETYNKCEWDKYINQAVKFIQGN